jgi:hypothetical protein
MIRILVLVGAALRALVHGRSELVLENLALRQQVAVLAAKTTRPRIGAVDRWFWLALRRCWSRWSEVLVFVKPETVVRWHRAGFRRYWTWLSRRSHSGRPRIRESGCTIATTSPREVQGWIFGTRMDNGEAQVAPVVLE